MAKKKGRKKYGITLRQAQHHLDSWLEASLEITTHQSYRLGNQTLTMADLDQVRRMIDYWSDKVEQLEALEENGGRNRFYRAVPRDY
ncbi:MAG: DUF6148 family protein [Clostridiales bacterium]|nr:DUF6148 family protein [Clostridiales bacterium]